MLETDDGVLFYAKTVFAENAFRFPPPPSPTRFTTKRLLLRIIYRAGVRRGQRTERIRIYDRPPPGGRERFRRKSVHGRRTVCARARATTTRGVDRNILCTCCRWRSRARGGETRLSVTILYIYIYVLFDAEGETRALDDLTSRGEKKSFVEFDVDSDMVI